MQGAAISRKLEPNENLILSAVNLIDDVPYSTYVKVLYNLNINPEDVYVNKDLQKEYTQLSINGETVAVIIPFKKDNVSVENLVVEDNGTVNISETIRNQEDSNKEIGDARRRLNERHLVDVPESQNVYTDSSFEITTINKL